MRDRLDASRDRYHNTKLTSEDIGNGKSAWTVEPTEEKVNFKTDRRVPKLGCVRTSA